MRESFVVTGEKLAEKYAEILPHLDERQRRLLLAAAAEARALGHGGIRVAAAAGVRAAAVSLGVSELAGGAVQPAGQRQVRARSTRAGMPGSGTSTARPGSTRVPGTR
jgi:hypothetical protein